jgi:hypothetical protein
MRGEYFSVVFSILMSHPESLQKPISARMRVQCFLSNEVGSRDGGRVRGPSCKYEVWGRAVTWEDQVWYAAGVRIALFVSVGGGETREVVCGASPPVPGLM